MRHFRSPVFVPVGVALALFSPAFTIGAEEAAPEAPPERLYVNDKKAPDSLKDLRKIQEALQSGLERAQSATVGIKLGQGSGSGVIVSEDGLILTAAHVSGDVDKEVTIVMEDGSEWTAETLGLNSNTDAAMARIVNEGDEKFPWVEMDLSDSARLGDWVYSIGHSGGVDEARGAVVRIGRLVKMSAHTFHSDCNLIGGDSGGPLFDMNGRLIGIHSRVGASLEENMHVPLREFQEHWVALSDGEFIGEGPFATRSNPAAPFLEGVELEDTEEKEGVSVKAVEPNSLADNAGLQEGDLITGFDGEEVADLEALGALLENVEEGDLVLLGVLRDGGLETIRVKFGDLPYLGVALEDGDEGVRVTRVGKESPAMAAGLEEGDLIQEFNGEKVADEEAFLTLLQKANPGDRVSLGVLRDGEIENIEVELEKR